MNTICLAPCAFFFPLSPPVLVFDHLALPALFRTLLTLFILDIEDEPSIASGSGRGMTLGYSSTLRFPVALFSMTDFMRQAYRLEEYSLSLSEPPPPKDATRLSRILASLPLFLPSSCTSGQFIFSRFCNIANSSGCKFASRSSFCNVSCDARPRWLTTTMASRRSRIIESDCFRNSSTTCPNSSLSFGVRPSSVFPVASVCSRSDRSSSPCLLNESMHWCAICICCDNFDMISLYSGSAFRALAI
mmetsp:Transcript_31371/g.75820  ORF Transcript_31371/g.75820 Transcript_31371/m.75820 type:complete len:246 (-) Transcript_31371:711-1448(-)